MIKRDVSEIGGEREERRLPGNRPSYDCETSEVSSFTFQGRDFKRDGPISQSEVGRPLSLQHQ
jgi:hypothetical protein